MRRIVVSNNVTLDGVMQAPGRPDEDPRGGFPFGGWALPYLDPVMFEAAAEGMAGGAAMLFGRRTYEDFASVWPSRPDDYPFARVLSARKYVVSTTLRPPLPWRNATLVEGNAPDVLATLKATDGPDLVILGSGELIRSLMPHGLIDEMRLLIHPLVLGTGRRLFDEGDAYTTFDLVDSRPTSTGVIIATYRRRPAP